MGDDASLRGWEPTLGGELTLADVVEHAFDYRGDVTVDRMDGTRVEGYLYNRDASAREPFVQLFEKNSGASLTLPYRVIANIRFTGRDAAAGQSYEAWKRSREEWAGSAKNRSE